MSKDGDTSEPTFDDLATRVDDAVNALEGLEPAARKVAEELQGAIEAIHKAGLVSIVRRLRAEDATRPALFELAADPAVHLLLSLHGIVRPDPVTHANQVLESVRPQLHSHGGDVSLVRVEDGTAFVRLEGACNGCSMSSVTLRNLVEEALVAEVPAVTAVEVVADQPSPTLIPLGPAAGIAVDDLTAVSLAGDGGQPTDVLIVNVGQRLSAYRNECAHEALPLTDAMLDLSNGTLTCPWHGFCYDASSGECLSAPGAQLEQLPLRIDDGDVWVRVGQ